MSFFRTASVKRKQMLIVMLTSAAVLLLACAGFVIYETVIFRSAMVQNATTISDIVGNNATAALEFNDAKSADEILSALRREPRAEAGAIYTPDGKVLATYHRADGATKSIPQAAKSGTNYFTAKSLVLFTPIVRDHETLGMTYIELDLQEFYSRLEQYLWIVVVVFFASCLAAFLISYRLQRWISDPILGLVEMARDVSRGKDYSQRAIKHSEDELGTLADSFNEMLAQIQKRDAELICANEALERRVEERTRELQQEVMERRRSEAALRESEERFRSVWERSLEGMRLTDREGRIVAANEAYSKLVRIPREELVGKIFSVTYAGHTHGDGLGIYQQRFDTGEIQRRFESRVELWNGEEVDIEVSSAMIESGATGKLVLNLFRDVTERKQAEAALKEANRQLLDISRQAGMAEVASSVLHNVGNVLNSVNVSAAVVSDKIRNSKLASLARATALMKERNGELLTYLANDPQGRQLPGFIVNVVDHLNRERQILTDELGTLVKNIEHIKDIVAMQQSYAKVSGVAETLSPVALVEDALQMNEAAMARHGVTVIREYVDAPPVTVERHKVLQILVNLIRNAKYALDEGGKNTKEMRLRIERNNEAFIRISVIDNGIGIPAENLTRIFAHGFTTRKHGHGFGLHSGAIAAKELGGVLTAQSEGTGRGAVFILDLPCNHN